MGKLTPTPPKLGFSAEGWDIKNVAGNLWKLSRSLTMTGSNVDTEVKFPAHRLVRLECYHTDSAHDASTDALDIRLFRAKGSIESQQHMYDDVYKLDDTVASSILKLFGESYEFEESTWTLRLNSTNTDIVEVALYIQVL